MRMFRRVFIFGLISALVNAGCAQKSVRESQGERPASEVLKQVCAYGESTKSVRGNTWMRVKSPEASGSFPASVLWTPTHLKIEITNLLGGQEALIEVEGDHYRVDGKAGRKRQEGYQSWGGIPLRWAKLLFKGQIPCPVNAGLARWQGEAIAQTVKVGSHQEEFLFHLRDQDGFPWVESLVWSTTDPFGKAGSTIDFKFEKPDLKTRSALIWEAKSSLGEVKLRWKDREQN